jgi:hypothetical protein
MDTGQFDRVFDQKNVYWTDMPVANRCFFDAVHRHAKDLLRLQGFLLLNDVYKLLGLEVTDEDSRVGWTSNTDVEFYSPEDVHSGEPFTLRFNVNSTNVTPTPLNIATQENH